MKYSIINIYSVKRYEHMILYADHLDDERQ